MKGILLLFLLISCSKDYEVHEGNGIFYIKDLQVEIEKIKEIQWRVGKKRKELVSQGIRFITSVPRVDKSGLERIQRKLGANAYIFRVSRLNKGSLKPLGHVHIPFKNVSRTTQNFTLAIYYAASAISKKFRSFHCPAFNHRLQITDFSLNDVKRSRSTNLFIKPMERVRHKVSQLSFAPQSFNAGTSLKGKYYVDVAIYSTVKKKRYSAWYPVNGEIEIETEESISVPSCLGIKEEINALPESRLPSLRDLKIR